MKQLKQQLAEHDANTRPVTQQEIDAAQHALGITFSEEYQTYLTRFGVIACGSTEIYGLGVPVTSPLNIQRAVVTLSAGKDYPPQAVPLCEIGDGYYSLYDNQQGKILTWSMIVGVVESREESLEGFLLRTIFDVE